MAKLTFGGKPNFAAVAPTPIPETRTLEPTTETADLVRRELYKSEAEDLMIAEVMDHYKPDVATRNAEEVAEHKLSQLLDDSFPFDDSQRSAIDGVSQQMFACLTGAAGTGKTTVTKAIVDRIKNDLGEVDMTNYFKRVPDGAAVDDPDDDYEMPESAIPSIVMVGFTGRSTQQIKKNFPQDWHGNIMTIHRCLAYMPVWTEEWDPEADDGLGAMKNKMHFEPTFNADNKLPWDVIVIDEAGMVGLDLWHNLFAAMKPGTRVIMIGDINQLPPVHGRSIFGFAMSKWPTWELTHVHRQQGVNNSIVDNAWRILKGEKPKSDTDDQRLTMYGRTKAEKEQNIVKTVNQLLKPDWKFAMVELPDEAATANVSVRQLLHILKAKSVYNPFIDSVITATNGFDGTRGELLGQIPLNRELAIAFNKENPRYVIDASRERKYFAVGDKVMATRNDHEAGITNGMTGIIIDINPNAEYAGETQRWGLISEVTKYLQDIGEEEEESDFTLEELAATHEAQEAGKEKAKEKRDRGPASHVVTVRFGEGDHGREIPFGSLAEVASLMVAYVVTCHKMQGGESPLVLTICHQAHSAMLYREWAYTAVTRSSERHILLYTRMGLASALNKQKIKGKTLIDKINAFKALADDKGLVGASVTVNIQDAESMDGSDIIFPQFEGADQAAPTSWAELLSKHEHKLEPPRAEAEAEAKPTPPAVTIIVQEAKPAPVESPKPKPFAFKLREAPSDATIREAVQEIQMAPTTGELSPDVHAEMAKIYEDAGRVLGVPKVQPVVPTHTPEQLLALATFVQRDATPLLTHQPQPVAEPEVKTLKYRSLGQLLKGKTIS